MATAVASQPLGPPKTKRPPAPFVQTSLNGNQTSNPSPSPSSALKRLPGQKLPPPTPLSASSNTNGVARPKRKESQRPEDRVGRLQRLQTRSNVAENSVLDRRVERRFPEPYVATEAHILKKFRGKAPSLIVHLHPTGFRFDQQDGNFSYHSEMRLFIEHLQNKTIPHDMLEEFRKSDVRFYDGWLIVRVVDHKSVAETAGERSTPSSDDQIPFSIHNYNQHITPSPYAPYPIKEQPKPSPKLKTNSPPMKHELGEASSNLSNGDSSSTVNGHPSSEDPTELKRKSRTPEPKVFHVALRPTELSRHKDLVIDSMTPDPRQLNRRQSNMPTPATPLSAVPPTPSFEKGPLLKRQKTKIDPKDLIDYEAKVVNAIAPPLFLDAVNSFDEMQALLNAMKDSHHDAEPPSPKGRKRTVAELAADDAMARAQERFMLIMDERNPAGPVGANPVNVDGAAAANIFQPRFERFNALEQIKANYEEKNRRDRELKVHQDQNRRAMQEHQEEEKRQQMMLQRQQAAQEMQRRRAMQERQAAVMAAQQQQGIPQANNIPPNVQAQMLAQRSQAQNSSPVVRTSTPHMNSSPIVGQPKGHGVPMSMTTSNQSGAGSPARPGSALQHAHPGVAMARGPSNQGPSRHGTPQMPHSTPGNPHATPIMRHGTPGQQLSQQMSQASPHGSMIANTPQMQQVIMNQGQMPNGMPAPGQQHAIENARRQLMLQQQNRNMQNGIQHQSPQEVAHMPAQRHAHMAQQAAIQQMQQQAGGGSQNPGQVAPAQHQAAMAQKQYQAHLRAQMNQQMQAVNQPQDHPGMQQGSPPQPHPAPQQQHAAQMQHQAAMQLQQQQHHAQQQIPNGIPHPGQPQQQMAQQPRPNQTNANMQQQILQRGQAMYQNWLNAQGGDLARIPLETQQQMLQQSLATARQQVMQMMQQQRARGVQMRQGNPGGGVNPQMQQQMMMQQAQQAQAQQQAAQQASMAGYQQHLQTMQQGHQRQGGM